MKPINVNTVKIRNRAAVFGEILRCREVTRQELARRCELSLGTVTSIIEELSRERVVAETKDRRNSVGRKPNLVKLIATVKRILTIDLASRNFVYEFIGVDLTEGVGGIHIYNEELSFEQNIRLMLEEVQKLMADSYILHDEIIGVGLSVPGAYRFNADRVDNSPFPELHSIPLKALIGETFTAPIAIEHDVFLSLRAEIGHLMEHRDKNVFFVFLGEGVGGALSIRGEVYRGSREDAGDIGRLLLNDSETLEELVSWRRTQEISGTDVGHAVLSTGGFSRLLSMNPPLQAHLDSVARHVARALYNVFWIVDPDTFIIGGEYQTFGVGFLELIRAHLCMLLGNAEMDSLEMTLSWHGVRAGRVGAGETVREAWLNDL